MVYSKRKENLLPSTVRGKNLLPRGANSFLLEKTPFQKGSKLNLTELSLLKVYLLCSPKNFGGAYSRRFVRASVRPYVRVSVRPSRSCPRKFSETACRISMKLHGNIKYQRWMRISPSCSGSMIFPRVIAL